MLMRRQLSLIFFIFYGVLFSQNLEESIYTATETFNNNSNATTYRLLEKQEANFKNQLKTKDEQLAYVFLLCNKGYYLKHKAPNKAISSYEDAWNRFSKYNLSVLSDYDIMENCLKPLGNLYTKTGNYTNAENSIKQYIFIAEKEGNVVQKIAGIINLSIVYQSIGNHITALKIINEATTLATNTTQKQKLLNLKSKSLIALKKYENITVLNDNNSSNSTQFNKHYTQYKLELNKKEYKKALISFNSAKKFRKNDSLSIRKTSKFYVEEAQLYSLLNKTNDALKSLLKAIQILLPNFEANKLPDKNNLYPENTFIDIFDLYASMQPNFKIALESYDLSFYVSNLLYNNITSQKAKIINQINNRKRSEKCIALLFNEYSKTKNSRFLTKAFQYAEGSKAQVLKETSQKKALLKSYPNDSLLIKEQRLLQEQEYVTNSLINEHFKNSKASKINEYSKQLNALSVQLKIIKNDILKAYPKLEKNSVSIIEIQKKLTKDNAALIEFFYGEHAIYQFVIKPNTTSFNKIDLDDNTRNSISAFIHLFDNASAINNNIANYTTQSFGIYKLLQLNAASTFKNIIIIPDGLLNFIPFEALLTSETETTNFSKMPFVITQQMVAYNSNAFFYLKNYEFTKNDSLLGVFPVFENSNKALIYSKNEANAIEGEMNTTLLMQEQATKSNFINKASNYSVLHLSTHATSGDFTIPASIDFYDNPMLLNELYSLNLSPDLVVLSACETGIGRILKGEGAMSMARGFQYSGAQNVLFSLWQINDKSTSQIIQLFYENYSQNKSAFISNHKSKIAYLQDKNISNIKKSPYYWSAFVYYGSVVLEQQNTSIFYKLTGIILFLIILFLIFKFYRQMH